jgi:hypothetical protein
VHLAHAHVQPAPPRPVQLAKPAVLVSGRVLLPVLLPHQAQRDALELQLVMDVQPIDLRTLAPRRPPHRGIEPLLELLSAPGLPGPLQHTGPLRPHQVLGHGRPPDPARLTRLPLAQTAHQQQPQNLLDLSHAESPCRHLSPFVVKVEHATASEPFSSLVPTGRRPPFRWIPATLPTTAEKWPPSRRNGWPPSARNGGRLHVGIPGRIRPEYACGPLPLSARGKYRSTLARARELQPGL